MPFLFGQAKKGPQFLLLQYLGLVDGGDELYGSHNNKEELKAELIDNEPAEDKAHSCKYLALPSCHAP